MKRFVLTCSAAAIILATSCWLQGCTPKEKETDTPDARAAAVLGEVRQMLGDSAIGKHYTLKIEDGGDTLVWKGTLDK